MGVLRKRKSQRDDIGSFDRLNRHNSPTYSLDTDPETLDHRRSGIKNNPLSGITCPRLLRLLWSRRASIDWGRYTFRLACLFLISILNSLLAAIEEIYLYFWIKNKYIPAVITDPVFILGHPRTGTTLLHSLLALDSEQFSFCNTFCAGFPHCFLWFEDIGKQIFAHILSPTRPMDNMKLHFDLPQEDELATCLLTGGLSSPYMSLYFPREEQSYRRYQTFRDMDQDEMLVWTRAFQKLCLKLSVRDQLQSGQSHRLVLKSPCHTGRVRRLLQLHPHASFIHVHRHPLDVFLSSVHMANTTYGYMFLQQPWPGDLKEYILKQGEILMQEYIMCVDEGLLVEGKNWTEVSFDDLTQRPFATMQSIYVTFGWPMSDSYQHELQEYCDTALRGYQRNQYDVSLLSNEVLQEVKSRWKAQFDRWKYS